MEQTQLLDWDEEGDLDDSSGAAGNSGETPKPVGRLHLLSSKYGPEKDFWIYPGENVIGRLESCQIFLPASSVSKAHAVIEVPSPNGPHLLYDRGSLNGTRRQRMVLIPEVRYSLQDGDTLLFGDMGCQYFRLVPEGISESPNESMEVPPTQSRVDATALAIEETPAPRRRMGFGGVLVQDSDKEEEGEEAVNGAGKIRSLPASDGSGSSIKDGAGGRSHLVSSVFFSPSATVVPESDEESEEPSDGGPPCPSMHLCFESQDGEPGPLGNGAVTPPSQEGHPIQPRTTETEAKAPPDLGNTTPKEQGAPPDHSLVDFHLDSDTDVEDEDRVHSASETPKSGDLVKDNRALEVDSDTDMDEPGVVNPDGGCQKNHQAAIDAGSDTDVEAAESPGVVGLQACRPAENGDDVSDAEEGLENPSVGSPGNCGPSHTTKGIGCKGREGAKDNPDVAHPNSRQPNEKGDSDTDVEEAIDNPDVCVRAQQPAEEDSDTDVEATSPKVENLDGTPKTKDAVGDSEGDTDVEMADLALENAEVACPRPTSCKGSSANVEEIPIQGVVLQNLGEGSRDDAVTETEKPSAGPQRSYEAASEQSRGFGSKEPLDKPEVAENKTVPPQNQFLPALSLDSDTDEEEEAENPYVDSKKNCKVTGAGLGGGGSPKPDVGPQKSPRSLEGEDSDTDVEVDLPSRKESVAQDRDTDVEGETAPLPAKSLGEQDTQLAEARARHEPCKEDEDTDAEGSDLHPGDDSNTDDDPDLALQATQCFLPVEASSPRTAKVGETPMAECSSLLNDDSSDAYMLEATQSYCQEPGELSEEPTQAFLAEEEEETELLFPRPPEEEVISEQATPPVVSVLSSRGQQAASLLGTSTQTYSIELSSPEAAPQPAGGVVSEELKEEEETQPVHSVQIASVGSSRPLTLQEAKEVPGSQNQAAVAAPEIGSTAELSQTQNMAACVDKSEDRSSAPTGETRDTEQVLEEAKEEPSQPVASALGQRRRSLRLSSAAAVTPTPVLEGRSRRCGLLGSGDVDGSREPVTPITRRRGLRQLSNPTQYMGEPEEKPEQPEGEEASPNKKPKNREPTVAPRRGRARCSQREAEAASRLKEEAVVAAGSPGTRERPKRGKRRAAAEPVEEQEAGVPRTRGASRRSSNSSVGTPSPKDSGKEAQPEQEPAGRRSRRQSTESKPAGTRVQPRNRLQSSAACGVPAPKVLFTGVIDEEGERVVKELGGSLAESVFDCTHLVTDRVRRTVKFLCALARGIPIVTLDWLEKSRRNSFFLAPNSFLVSDSEQEKNFRFSLSASLQRARQEGPLLQGYEIHITPNVKPEPEHMRDIVKCSGGTFLPRMPRAYKDKRIIISCPEDLPRCKAGQDARVPIANSEFILMGILQQKVDLDAYRLAVVGSPSIATPTTRSSRRRAAAPTTAASPSTAKRRR
ncbi:mediator of DNA damage checkpoint protein 1 isoform X2 [Rhineura floridana]|uniref:mediator of DNA damage checkpoint protein 1 isoform X2 n=1 Tax=Rhineura floridana TaxID=261503 RepID=UPI002AC82E08|nr:mediator of DNA damage checkpoint protein 1 isoform X2 [Rhineura floridana]